MTPKMRTVFQFEAIHARAQKRNEAALRAFIATNEARGDERTGRRLCRAGWLEAVSRLTWRRMFAYAAEKGRPVSEYVAAPYQYVSHTGRPMAWAYDPVHA